MITTVNNCVMHFNIYYLWKLKVNYILNFIVDFQSIPKFQKFIIKPHIFYNFFKKKILTSNHKVIP